MKISPNTTHTFWHNDIEVMIKTDKDCRVIEKEFREQYIVRHVLRVWKDYADMRNSCTVAEFPVEQRLQAAQMAGLLLLDPRVAVVGIEEICEKGVRKVDEPPWFKHLQGQE